MAASLVGLGLFLAGASACAQQAPAFPAKSSAPHPQTSETTIIFSRSPLQAGSSPALPQTLPAQWPDAADVRQPSAPAGTGVLQTAMQRPPDGGIKDERQPIEDITDFNIQLEPPGPEKVFRLESECTLQERMRQEARQRRTGLERIYFPDEPAISNDKYTARHFPPAQEVVEPYYVCHQRLLFEDLNSERYGWDMGFIQPVVSSSIFFWDVLTLPYHAETAPCRCYECNTGYCLPGDPVPYLLYPPELSITGAIAEAAVVGGLVAIFPGF